jgi:lysophospholipase L1-like esterase
LLATDPLRSRLTVYFEVSMNAKQHARPASTTTRTPGLRWPLWLLLCASLPCSAGCESEPASSGTVASPSASPAADAPSASGASEAAGGSSAAAAPAPSGVGEAPQGGASPPLATPPELGSSALDPSSDASAAPASDGPADAEGEPAPAGPAAFQPCPQDGSACAILPFGDSITFGEGSSGGGYRVELFRQAVQASQRITFIGTAPPNGPTDVAGQPFPRAHQGHQGFVINGGGFSPTASLSLVLDDALPVLDPHIVLLMAGTNDVNGNNDLAGAPARLVGLLDQIDATEPEALVVVAQLTPTRDAVLNARIETFNAAIAVELGALAATGRHVAVVDMYTPFVQTPDYQNALLFDRLHPNDAGYALMAGVWYEAIRALLPSAGATP